MENPAEKLPGKKWRRPVAKRQTSSTAVCYGKMAPSCCEDHLKYVTGGVFLEEEVWRSKIMGGK